MVALARRQTRQVLAQHLAATALHRQHTREHRQQRRFATTTRALNEQVLGLRQLQMVHAQAMALRRPAVLELLQAQSPHGLTKPSAVEQP